MKRLPKHLRTVCAAAGLLSVAACVAPRTQDAAPAIQTTASVAPLAPAWLDAIGGPWRSPANRARDVWRHPGETLAFLGVQPDQTIIEITPGGGWYAEILAPTLRARGQYVAAVVNPDALPAGGGRDYQTRMRDALAQKFAQSPAQFDRAQVVAYDPASPVFGAPASADAVLTFRNVHNWRMAGQAEGMFRGFFAVLKPGGTLGVVEHRAASDVANDDRSGYVGEQQVIKMAEAVGFKLLAKSDINANPRDTKNHPQGVWMLPPTNNHDASEAARYQTIGESDRMTLRFVKPR